MMEKKGTIGVLIFGYFGLIYMGVGALLEELIKFPPVFPWGKIFIDLAFIISSYYLLRLKNLARISLLILNGIFGFVLIVAEFIALSASYEKWMEILKEEHPFFPMFGVIELLVMSIYFVSFLIFFTRSSVKDQFN